MCVTRAAVGGNVGDNGATALAGALMTNTSVTEINLFGARRVAKACS